MKLGLMQPYFFPYIGYFQLIFAVDKFIIYDTVNYIKNGWIKRNRYLLNDEIKYFTLSIHKASSNKPIIETYIADEEVLHSKEKIVKTIHMAYSKAPYYDQVISMIDDLVLNPEQNISLYNTHIIKKLCSYLDIGTEILLGSRVLGKSSLSGQDRVIEICKMFNSQTYINPIGGVKLYDSETFNNNNINLFFIKTSDKIKYRQWNDDFYPNLSIIDLLMFNDKTKIRSFLKEYTLVKQDCDK